MKLYIAIAAILAILVGCTPADGATSEPPAPAVSLAAASPPVDTTGNYLIDAHDGEIIQAGGEFIQYGTTYACGFQLLVPESPWCGIRMMTSLDLVTWVDRGLAFDPAPYQERCTGRSFGCFRPHVLPRPDGSWVMWVNVADPTERSGYAVLTADNPLGPFTEVARPHLSVDMGHDFGFGDHDLVIDADGTGWIVYTGIGPKGAVTHDLIVERLDPTLTTGTGQFTQLGLVSVEAPSLFGRGGLWYLLYSDPTCGYCGSTGTGYQTAPTPLGPWTPQGRITETSCNGQPAAVNELMVDGQPVWLYQSDLWQQLNGSWNPNQAQAPTHIEPLAFTADGLIAPLGCGE